METIVGRADTPLRSALIDQAHEFDFHQAINILERFAPNSTPIGEGSDPSKEAFEIKSRVTLAVSSSDIHQVQMDHSHSGKPILWINFLGLAGIQGPLPTPYTEMLIDRIRSKDMALRDFLDIFNHRLASLWYRLRKKISVGVAQIPPQENPLGEVLLNLIGLDKSRNLLAVPDQTLMSYHTLFWQRLRSVSGLGKILNSHFNVPIKIDQFQGKWRQGIPEDLSVIGISGQHQRLGQSMILGSKTWDQTSGITINIGPLNWEKFCDFLPNNDGKHYQELRDLCYFYVGFHANITLCLILNKRTMVPVRLNRELSLGQNTWLKTTKTPPKDLRVSMHINLLS